MVLRSGPVNGRAHIHLNQTTKDWHSRSVTLSEAKGLAVRFFASLRMTLLNGCIAKRTNVVHFDLVECSLLASNSNPINIPSPFFCFRCREVLIAYMNTK